MEYKAKRLHSAVLYCPNCDDVVHRDAVDRFGRHTNCRFYPFMTKSIDDGRIDWWGKPGKFMSGDHNPEMEAFERACAGEYVDEERELLWRGWQARAAAVRNLRVARDPEAPDVDPELRTLLGRYCAAEPGINARLAKAVFLTRLREVIGKRGY